MYAHKHNLNTLVSLVTESFGLKIKQIKSKKYVQVLVMKLIYLTSIHRHSPEEIHFITSKVQVNRISVYVGTYVLYMYIYVYLYIRRVIFLFLY